MISVAVVLGLLGAVACGGDDADEVRDAAQRQIDLTSKGQFGDVWEMLHPGQQAVVPKQLYIDCGRVRAQTGSTSVDRIEIDEVEDETLDIPWVGETDAKVVSATLFRGEDPSFREVAMVKSGDQWRWVIGSDHVSSLEAFQRGECP